MVFNDDKKSYKLETPGGKKITLHDLSTKKSSRTLSSSPERGGRGERKIQRKNFCDD